MRLKTYLKGLGLGIFVTALIMSLASNETGPVMTDAEIMARAAELGMVSENAMLLKEAQALADSAADRASRKPADTSVSADKQKEGKASENKAAVSINGQISGNKAVSSNGEIVDIKKKPEVMTASSSALSQNKAAEKEDKAAVAGTGNGESGNMNPSEKETSGADVKPAAANVPAADDTPADISPADTGAETEVVVINVSSGDSSVSVAAKMVQAGLIDDARQFDSYLVLSGYDRKLVVGPHPIPKGSTAAEMGAILTSKQ
ncbi:MAG: hypothetical protein J5966_03445 [Lachnospiraceae bacterium]|nr:hypothetical protein [Lachnospiraceae bacterium]